MNRLEGLNCTFLHEELYSVSHTIHAYLAWEGTIDGPELNSRLSFLWNIVLTWYGPSLFV